MKKKNQQQMPQPKNPGIAHFACGATLAIKHTGNLVAGSRHCVFAMPANLARPCHGPHAPATCLECPVKSALSDRRAQTGWVEETDERTITVTCRITKLERP